MARRKTKKSVRDASRKVENLENSCFTIMPFGERFDSYFEMVYKPAIIEAGLFPTRADDLYRPGPIISDIWMYTQKAKVVLADLAGKNPNVFYELGLAHAISKPVILAASSMDDVPFDLRHLRVLEYDQSRHNWGELLQYEITSAIKEVLKSPTAAIPSPFLDVKETQNPVKITEYESAMREIRRELEALRQEIQYVKRPSEPTPTRSYSGFQYGRR